MLSVYTYMYVYINSFIKYNLLIIVLYYIYRLKYDYIIILGRLQN